MSDEFDRAYWEEHYREHTAHSRRGPNATLVAEAANLAPGTALDAGCGQGADAIWLASRGWQVTAVDISATALRRAQAEVDGARKEVADRIEWREADLTTWTPPQEKFDLVSAQYVHVPEAAREPFLQRLATAVAPGGTLLVVGHHPSDQEGTVNRGSAPELYVTAEQISAVLDSERWQIDISETRPRAEARGHSHEGHGHPEHIHDEHGRRGGGRVADPDHGHGQEVTAHDTVLRARRHP